MKSNRTVIFFKKNRYWIEFEFIILNNGKMADYIQLQECNPADYNRYIEVIPELNHHSNLKIRRRPTGPTIQRYDPMNTYATKPEWRKNKMKHSSRYRLPDINKGLSLISMAPDIVGELTDYNKLVNTMQSGKFIMKTSKNAKAYSWLFYGNQYIDKMDVEAAKKGFKNQIGKLRFLKVLGHSAALFSVVQSTIKAIKSGKCEDTFDASYDIILLTLGASTGVSFGTSLVISGVMAYQKDNIRKLVCEQDKNLNLA